MLRDWKAKSTLWEAPTRPDPGHPLTGQRPLHRCYPGAWRWLPAWCFPSVFWSEQATTRNKELLTFLHEWTLNIPTCKKLACQLHRCPCWRSLAREMSKSACPVKGLSPKMHSPRWLKETLHEENTMFFEGKQTFWRTPRLLRSYRPFDTQI